ncbi:MAG: hypothetical protein EOP37_03005 [Rubrivivax sp.]|nr:MAG: hypothetical protein EOP37_03005 [Rubrivivax sp.]
MNQSNRFSPEVRERAVRMVLKHRGECPSLSSTSMDGIAAAHQQDRCGIVWKANVHRITHDLVPGLISPTSRARLSTPCHDHPNLRRSSSLRHRISFDSPATSNRLLDGICGVAQLLRAACHRRRRTVRRAVSLVDRIAGPMARSRSRSR